MTTGYHFKGERRKNMDRDRYRWGEPARNEAPNATPNCRYKPGSKAFRKRGRNRYKTGRKSRKK